jgi:DNA-binding NarL/FixJ family response regulator
MAPLTKITNKQDLGLLSIREIQVVNLIVQEFNNDDIALALKISKRTVETHRKNIFKKTKSKTIIGLVVLAIKHKLVQI